MVAERKEVVTRVVLDGELMPAMIERLTLRFAVTLVSSNHSGDEHVVMQREEADPIRVLTQAGEVYNGAMFDRINVGYGPEIERCCRFIATILDSIKRIKGQRIREMPLACIILISCFWLRIWGSRFTSTATAFAATSAFATAGT